MRYSEPLPVTAPLTSAPSISHQPILPTKRSAKWRTIIPPSRVLSVTFLKLVIVECKVVISSGCFPQRVIFSVVERRGNIEKAFESYQVSKCCHRIVQHNVQPPRMHLVDAFSPDVDRSEVNIKEGEIQWTEGIRSENDLRVSIYS